MLVIRILGHLAVWEYDDDQNWESDDAIVTDLLQLHYDVFIRDTLSVRDVFRDFGVSGEVLKHLQNLFPDIIELVKLQPEEVPMEKPGVVF